MTSANAYLYRFQSPDLPLEERVADLISRLTLQEKIEQMCQYQAEVPRLNLAAYKHGTEGAHGVAWLGEATVFPQNSGLACTWNPELMKEIGSVIADEARIYHKKDPKVNGLTIWAPTVDMERDPRWGRTEEAYGEDPYLTGRLTTELVKGMQGEHPFYYKTVATLKHFYANNNEVNRGSASVSIDPRNKREYYLKAFEPAFREGRAGSMMTAYNAVNGVPCNVNPEVNHIVKGEWGMDGFVVGDAGDVLGTVNDHRYVHSYAEAVARSVKSGIDSITDDQEIVVRALQDALEQGLLEEADLDRALQNTFRVRFRLGEFDPVDRNPYAAVDESLLCAEAHSRLSQRAAKESIVLLKNDNLLPLGKELGSLAVIGPLADEVLTDWYSGTPSYRITPLQGIAKKMKHATIRYCSGSDRVRLRSLATGRYVAIGTGEAEACERLAALHQEAEQAAVFSRTDWGWGSETLREEAGGRFVTERDDGYLYASAEEVRGWFVKEAVSLESGADGTCHFKNWQGREVCAGEDGSLKVNTGAPVDNSQGDFSVEVVSDGIAEAVKAAKASDAAIIFAGNIPFLNGKEEVDRQDITLPPAQQRLIQAVLDANPNTVVVLVSSYPYAVKWEQEHIPSILYTSHAGPELGSAVADVLFGDYNPGGRLAMTWYRSQDQLPDIMDYDLIKGKRTYQYFEGPVLYPFGHGLSYTTFNYTEFNVSSSLMSQDGEIEVTVSVKNEGHLTGEEVVQLYVRADRSRVPRPIKSLRGFKRLELEPGEKAEVGFRLKAEDLAFWDVTRDGYAVEPGTYTVMVGSSSQTIHASTAITVEGEPIPPRSFSRDVLAENFDDYEAVYLDECSEGGTCVRVKGEEGWISFWDVGLAVREGRDLVVRAAGSAPGAVLEVRLEEADGPLMGAAPVPPTGGSQAWTTLRIPLKETSGRYKVFLVLKGEVSISRFRLE
ncbi:glycoside hydrolase family 3 protein [Paenibacillus sp. J22TS3]|uniref:glycoside hydrolase family 3 protein n=1 Tax=Paenibacillus sp. J22TS3 TaxID=2807192 RepID=UPI001BD1A5B3|nr:glycoside hydrolase family 3 protein [Paenibacillus sp. J22TS3]